MTWKTKYGWVIHRSYSYGSDSAPTCATLNAIKTIMFIFDDKLEAIIRVIQSCSHLIFLMWGQRQLVSLIAIQMEVQSNIKCNEIYEKCRQIRLFWDARVEKLQSVGSDLNTIYLSFIAFVLCLSLPVPQQSLHKIK